MLVCVRVCVCVCLCVCVCVCVCVYVCVFVENESKMKYDITKPSATCINDVFFAKGIDVKARKEVEKWKFKFNKKLGKTMSLQTFF